MIYDEGIVIKDSNGLYFCGLKVWEPQLRKAKIYKSVKMAEKVIQAENKLGRNCMLYNVAICEKGPANI